ncbi:MAG: TolC family protein [Akkermansiaceae bacterium]|nr:TolC family protein [Akkermansiaceae bacterium]
MRLFALSSSIIIIALSGCQTSSSVSNGSSRSNDLPLTRTQATNYGIASSAGVEQLVSQALKHHPSLAAARQKIIRLQAKIPQAQALPDPKARISAGSLAQTAAGQVDAVAGVEQAIPFPGKRRAKANAAQKEADAAKAELENLKLRVAERVRFAFWDYYLAHQNQRISRESKEVLQTIQEIVQARVKANQGTQADLLRISTEISKVDQQLIAARQQTSSAKATLNALLNRPSHSSLPYPKRSSVPSSGNLNSLIARAESAHPSVKAGQARLTAFQHRLRNAKLDAYPDFLIGAQHSWVSDSGLSPVADGRDQTMFTLGMTIPLWQKPRKARVAEANAGIAEMQAGVASSRAELRQRVEDAWFRAKSSREMITLFDNRLLPDAQQAHELALQSYSAGKQSFVDVLDTWRLLLKFQLQQEGNRASLGKASASLKSAAAIR